MHRTRSSLDLRPEDVVLPAGVDAVVREVEPRSLTLRFESTWSRKVSVRSAVDIATTDGSGAGVLATIEPARWKSPVRGISWRTSISCGPSRRRYRYPDSLPHLVDIDTSALGPGVRVRPAQVRVSLARGGSGRD